MTEEVDVGKWLTAHRREMDEECPLVLSWDTVIMEVSRERGGDPKVTFYDAGLLKVLIAKYPDGDICEEDEARNELYVCELDKSDITLGRDDE